MASQSITLRVDGILKIQANLRAGRAVLEKPFGGRRGRAALNAVRNKAKNSVRQQFDSQTFVGLGGSTYTWKKTGPFGRRRAPKSTMNRDGKYRRAWLGGPGKFERVTDSKIEWGVNEATHPQVKIHQRTSPFWIKANPANLTRKGHLAMKIKLYFLTGIFFRESMLINRGFLMQPRKIGLNRSMLESVIEILQRAYDSAVNGRPGAALP